MKQGFTMESLTKNLGEIIPYEHGSVYSDVITEFNMTDKLIYTKEEVNLYKLLKDNAEQYDKLLE